MTTMLKAKITQTKQKHPKVKIIKNNTPLRMTITRHSTGNYAITFKPKK